MNRSIYLLIALMSSLHLTGQDEIVESPQNLAGEMMNELVETRLVIGGYGQIDFNQPLEGNTYRNGTLDVHRFVLLFAYRFTDRLKLVSEIELEHVSEVYVEQAFINFKLTDFMNLRGGLLLIPMGIVVNEYHEPPTFNGVERPNLDKIYCPINMEGNRCGSFRNTDLHFTKVPGLHGQWI